MPTPQSEIARQQIEFARQYTLTLLADVADDEWFVMPAGFKTHLAWQMGHLAMAEYGLTMLRVRGKEPDDQQFISNDFVRLFMKGSTPESDPGRYPPVPEIRKVFDEVHRRAMEVIPTYSEELLAEPAPDPTIVSPTKLGALFFCAAHEMLHAGQIGMLRRMLGKAPVR